MERYTKVCEKPWCKATFIVLESNLEKGEDGSPILPKFCPNCEIQEPVVSWEEKKYEGERWDGTPHEFRYKIKKYY